MIKEEIKELLMRFNHIGNQVGKYESFTNQILNLFLSHLPDMSDEEMLLPWLGRAELEALKQVIQAYKDKIRKELEG
uniref:Uncharacterized protein n=1 Tax=viral metagenome TaxID=1070528 RepID=A0A6M3IFF0_9ZZZZ